MIKFLSVVLVIFTLKTVCMTVFSEVFTFEDFQSQFEVGEDSIKTEEQIAIEDAKRDANNHIDKYKWLTTGCILPILSLSLSQRMPERIPSARLIGKSQIYVAFYTEQYRIEMKKRRYLWALGGCALSSLITGSIGYGVFSLRK